MFTTIAVLRDPWEAHLLRGRLEAEQIPVIVIHEFNIAMAWDMSLALGGVKVQVPFDWQERAKEVERFCRDGTYKQLLADEFGDLDDIRCPYCGCDQYQKRRPYPRAAVAIVFSGLAGGVWPPKGWIYGCKACGARYRPMPAPWTKWPKMAALSVLLVLILFAAAALVVLVLTTKLVLVALAAGLIAGARWVSRIVTDHDSESEPSGGSEVNTDHAGPAMR